MNENVKRFIDDFSNKLISNKASFFIGSGISRSAGYVGWSEMLDDKAREIGLDINKEYDLISLAQYYVNANKRAKINHSISSFFDDNNGNPTKTHSLLCNMPFSSIWTTNYDSLLERQLRNNDILYNVITNDYSYRNINNNAKVTVYKIHGTYSSPNECVLTRDDYEKYHLTHDIVLSQLKAEMCSKSFLFLGYGFRDTDINHILSNIRQIYDDSMPHQHYCIMKKVSIDENGVRKSEEQFLYETKKEEHFISDMKNYGIETILINDFNEIDDILMTIRRKTYSKNVLISGSCDEIDDNIFNITTHLTSLLVKKGYKIYTGYGKNIGNMIVEGYFSGCSTRVTSPVTKFSEAIKIIPFPFKNKSNKKDEIYYKLRKSMAELTTIQIVIAGKGKINDGTYNEYTLSKEKKNLIIPIGITGGTAKLIWDEIFKEFSEDVSEEFKQLNLSSDAELIVSAIFRMIERGQL